MQIKRVFFILLALAAPLVLAQIWFKNNHAYPIYDAANYFILTQKIREIFLLKGFTATLNAVYTMRPWKPVILSAFGVPFLILSNRAVLPAIQMTMTCFLIFFLIYTFLVFRLRHSCLASVAGTWFIGTLPWLMQSSFVFQTELPHLAFLTAAIYHFLRSHSFKIKSHSVISGIWLALAIMLRPVETVLILFIPLFVFCAIQLREKTLSQSELVSFCFTALFSISIFFCTVFDANSLSLAALVSVIIASLITCFYNRPRKLKSGFTIFYVTFIGLDLLWYLPFSKDLYYWLYVATFGDFVKVFGERLGLHFLVRNGNLFFGGWTFPFLLIAFALCIKLILKFERRKKILTAAILAALSLPVIIGCISLNMETRYIFSSLLIFYFIATSIALSTRARFFSPLLFTPLLLANILFTYQLATGEQWVSMSTLRHWVKWNETISAWRTTPLRKIDPAKALIDQLSSSISVKKTSRIGLIRMAGRDLSAILEMDIFQVITAEARLPWSVRSDIDFENRTSEQWRNLLQQEYDFLLIGNIDNEPDGYTVSTYGKTLINAFKNNSLAGTGWEFVDKITLKDENGLSARFLLVKTQPRKSLDR